MYSTVLVPLDGSELAARALPLAMAIARHCDATLHLVTVHDPSVYIPFVPGEVAVPVYDTAMVRARHDQAERELNDAANLLAHQGIRVQSAVLEGTVVESLAEHAIEIGADLTVMTTHGRTGYNRAVLGSIAHSYVTRAHQPTLLIRGDDASVTPTELPSGVLLCPLDGSTFAECILPYARNFAETFGMTMELVSVMLPGVPPTPPFGGEVVLPVMQDYAAQEETRSAYLDRVASSCPPGTVSEVVADSAVADAIVDACKEHRAGAMALATHGRGGFMRMVLGSVAHDVLRNVSCPVLVYRPDNAKNSGASHGASA